MVDFDSGKHSGFDTGNGAESAVGESSNGFQQAGASYSPGTRILTADANGVVTLPAGVSLDDITVQGRDLVITLADGSTIVIPDGAIIVPQIVIDGVAVPPLDIAALLNGIDPQAQPTAPGSSGGNFTADEGAIQNPFDLGDLLPYTELFRPLQTEQEIIPQPLDRDPDVVIETPDNPVGVENAIATVAERGLPARGGEGAEEPAGTADETSAETTTGTIVFNSPDGLSAILINGVAVTSVGQEFTTPFGTMTITSINLATGEIGFSYTLADNLLGSTADGNFAVTVIDTDGDQANATLSVIVEDDSPIAADDIGVVPGGSHAPISGNVLPNDEPGADDYPAGEGGPDAVTGFSNAGGSADPGESLQGTYGVLTLNADGSYTYVRDYNTPGGVTDSFTYTITDQDGSTDTAVLTIEIGDAPNSIDFVPQTGEGTVVDEGALAPRDGEPVGTGEGADGDPDNNSDPDEATGATIEFNSPDGLASVTIEGVAITPGSLPQTIFSDATGSLVITGFTYDPVTGDGTITYEYTLADNTDGDDTSVSFDIVVTDLDGDTASDILTITITDDEPVAADDADSVTEDGPLSASGNVITDAEANGDNGADTEGADGVTVTGVAAGSSTDPVSGDVDAVVTGKYGSITIDAEGNYTYTLDNTNPLVQGLDQNESLTDEVFTYTVTDGDGDTSTTTVTITVNGADDPVVITGLDGAGAEEIVDEDDLADGSSPDAAALTQSGSFTIDSVDGLAAITVGGTTVFGPGVVYPVAIAGSYGEVRITGVVTTTDANGDVVSATVSYEYTLGDNTLDHSASGEDTLTDSFAVIATDSDGSSDTASLDITVVDDIPAVDPADAEVPVLATDDTALAGNPSTSDSGDFSALFAAAFGADGPAAADSLVYGLSINGGNGTDSGLNDAVTDENILLRISAGDPNVIEGYLAGSGDIAFTLTLDPSNGVITQTQFRAIEHDNPADGAETTASGEAETMAADLIGLTATVTDGDGDQDSASVDIGGAFHFEDDMPAATDNSNMVAEGGSTSGNILTDNDGSGTDSAGADGYAAGGAVVGVASTNQGTSTVAVDGLGNYVLAGEFGTLTVNAVTGEYTYVSNANSTNADDQDVFTYTIRDGDGDESAATLTIDVDNVGGEATDGEVDVNEAGLPFGSNPASDSEIDADGQIVVTGAAPGSTLVYSLTGTNADGDGTFGTLVLNPNTGEYTYTLDSRFAHDPVQGTNVEVNAESFNYEVRDTNGNLVATGTIEVNITDDIPTIVIDPGSTDPDMLVTQDAETRDAAFDTATGDVSQAFTLTTQVFGADGAGSQTTTYAMTLLAAAGTDSGLDSNGASIFIYQLADGTVIGSTALSAPADASDASVVFSITVDANSGLVTLTQFAEIDHGGPGDIAAPYDGQLAALADNLVGVTATATIVDADGDSDSDTATVDLGGFVKFADDGPAIDASVTDDDSIMLVTQDAETRDAAFDTASSIANFSGAFAIASSDFGADGAGSTAWAFSFAIENAASGLSSNGAPITLYLIGGKVVGSTAADILDVDAGNTIFDLSVVAGTGVVTLTQYAELDHADNNDTAAPYDDQLIALADNLVNLVGTATITDGDGDTASETVSLDLGGNVKFADDGPSITDVLLGSAVDVDESDGFPTSDTSAGSIISYLPDYGADGPGFDSFTIDVTDADSGLATAVGDFPITLVQVNATTIEGHYDGANVAFIVTINANGSITLTQNVALEHLVDGSTPADHNDTLDLAGKISATVTVTDGDADEASASIDIGGALTFFDDGPSVVASNIDDDSLMAVTSDADIPDSDATGISLAGLFDFTPDYGADGQGGAASESYGIDLVGDVDLGDATVGIDSGLTSGGQTIYLYQDGNSVVASTAALAGNVLAGNTIFTIAVDPSTGALTLSQTGPLDHTDNGSSTDSQLVLGTGLVNATYSVTVTDGDGDTDTSTQTADLGGNIKFDDDVPLARDDTDSTAEGGFTAGNVVLGTGSPAGTVGADDSGADGFGSPTVIGITSVNMGTADSTADDGFGNFVLAGEFGTLTLKQNGNYVYESDPDKVLPPGETDVFTYTIVDADGDTSTATLTITILDVTLQPDDQTKTVFEAALDLVQDDRDGTLNDDLAVGSVTGSQPGLATETVSGQLGVTGAGITYSLVSFTDNFGEFQLNANGSYTYTLTDPVLNPTGDNGTNTFTGVETIKYLATDANGNTVEGTITIDVVDDVPTAAIDVSGLSLTLDETLGNDPGSNDVTGPLAVFAGVANVGVDPDAGGSVIGYAQDVGGIASTGTVLGADGGTIAYSLDVSSVGVDSGLDTTGGQSIFLFKEGNLIVGRVGNAGGDAAFAIAVDSSTGTVSMVQYLSIQHPTGGTASPDEAVSIVQGAILATVTVTDGDGDISSTSTGIGNLISFEDDAGTLGTFSPSNQTILNETNAMATGTFAYDTGVDGHGSFSITGPTIAGVLYQPLEHGLIDLTDNGIDDPVQGTTLTATTLDGTIDLFTFQVDVDGNYKFTLVTPDAATSENLSFSQLSAGGPGFRELDDDPVTPVNENGRVEFTSNGTGVNANANDFGVSNSFLDPGEWFQMEFHNPGADGDQAALTDAEFLSSVNVIVNTLQNSPGNIGPNVTLQWTAWNDATNTSQSGTVTVTGTGPVTIDPTIDFNRLQITNFDDPNLGNDGARIQIGGLTIFKTILPSDQTFDFDVTATDGDGDVTSTSTVTINIDATPPVPPVVLDLNGGGADFSSLAANIAYDYDGDGVKTRTAWIAAGSAILAYDANADGAVTNASEFVFGGNGETDLEAIARLYDSNSDGKLDTSDPAYGKFGVWIDANLDANADAGEYVSLADAGITSIDLVSDGIQQIAGDGDVTVFGTASFTMADGSIGQVADAGFATGGDVTDAGMEALLALSAEQAPAGDPSLLAVADDVVGKTQAQLPDVAAILDDVMAGQSVDAMIDHFAGDAGHAPQLAAAASYLGSETLTQVIDGGAFAFDNSTMADMPEEAAALVAAHA